MFPPKFEIFLLFSKFPKIVLSCLATREAARLPSLLRDIKFRFICGESNLPKIIEKFQNIMTRIVTLISNIYLKQK